MARSPESNRQWYARGRDLRPPNAFGIMGILNLTPDSFFDGGKYTETGSALERISSLVDQKADIIDVGAESTRPGAQPVVPPEEIRRLGPVIALARKAFPEAVLSVDTRNADTAAAVLDAGASVINDVSACSHDPALVDVLAQFRPGYILMHSRGKPQNMASMAHYDNVVDEVKSFFGKKLAWLIAAGLPEENIILDPGIGFAKKLEHNLEILARIDEFLEFGRPILAAISMKSLFGELLDLPVDKRGCPTATVSALLWEAGVQWHRVHDVAGVRNALFLAASLAGMRRMKHFA